MQGLYCSVGCLLTSKLLVSAWLYFSLLPRPLRVNSDTTRAPRPGEENGKAYHFVTVDKFEDLIKEVRPFYWTLFHFDGADLCLLLGPLLERLHRARQVLKQHVWNQYTSR